jgi:hypothetical protein
MNESMIVNTFKRYGSDWAMLKHEAEQDAEKNLRFMNGKVYPYAVNMSTVKGKIEPRKICFKAEIIIFETELERDRFVNRQVRVHSIDFYKLNDN